MTTRRPQRMLRRGRFPRLPTALCAAMLSPAPAPAEAQETWQTDFSKHSVPLEEIVSGGPPKDGILAIDQPHFVSTSQADWWLEDREPVVIVQQGGEARIHPYQILIFHEIVNDRIAGRPLAITYCPLCNTALVFDRRVGDRVLDFGTTGRLRHSDLVMYDRQTESWWQQATGEAIVGELTGGHLQLQPAQSVSWETARSAFPEADLLSRETGHDRPYGTNPYAGYDTSDGPFQNFFQKVVDDRLPAMERVAALTTTDTPVAYPFSRLSERRVVHDEVDGRDIVVLWLPGTASALDRGTISDGRTWGRPGSSAPGWTVAASPSSPTGTKPSGTGRPAAVGPWRAWPWRVL